MGSTPPHDPGGPRPTRPYEDEDLSLIRLGLPEAANELVAMVAYLTAADGPLQAVAGTLPFEVPHARAVRLMRQHVDVIANFLRNRISFFIRRRREEPDAFGLELELAGANLEASLAVAAVLDSLLAARTPSEPEFDRMGNAALAVYSALDAL